MIGEFFKSSFLKKGENPDRATLLRLLLENAFDLGDDETRFLRNVLDLQDKIVREIMVPRIDMVTVHENGGDAEVVARVQKFGHSRMPMIGEDADTVSGIVYAKDFLGCPSKARSLKDICREPYFVPETKKVLDLLNDFQKKRIHMAIVVDEYGGVSGLVTMEDILEMFVGDIQDEYDNEAEQVVKVRKNLYNIDARISVAEINEYCGVTLPVDLADSFGGLFLELFGAVPEKNDTVTYENYKLRILSVEGSRILRVQLSIQAVKAEQATA